MIFDFDDHEECFFLRISQRLGTNKLAALSNSFRKGENIQKNTKLSVEWKKKREMDWAIVETKKKGKIGGLGRSAVKSIILNELKIDLKARERMSGQRGVHYYWLIRLINVRATSQFDFALKPIIIIIIIKWDIFRYKSNQIFGTLVEFNSISQRSLAKTNQTKPNLQFDLISLLFPHIQCFFSFK